MMDPFSFNQLGKIRQQEILEEAERNRDAITFGEMAATVKGWLVAGWHKAQSLRVRDEACDEPVPGITTETC